MDRVTNATITANTSAGSASSNDGDSATSNGIDSHSSVLIPISFLPRTTRTEEEEDDDDHPNRIPKEKLQEWAMIEINGELILPPSLSSSTSTSTTSMDSGTTISMFDTRTNVELGSISFDTSHPSSSVVVPIMIIGTHELRGTIIELQQPFVCLQKHTKGMPRVPNDETAVPMMESDNDNDMDDRRRNATTPIVSTEYVIRGIVKYKFIFNQYPKTIMR